MLLPPRSPFGLIQEDLWPDQWKILVSCIMLNCTTRKSAEKIMLPFFEKWKSPNEFLKADPLEVKEFIKRIGFADKRTKILFSMTRAYLENWNDVRDLPGIGEYGFRAWEIFCKNYLGSSPPKDHALTKYWHWRVRNDQKKNANGS